MDWTSGWVCSWNVNPNRRRLISILSQHFHFLKCAIISTKWMQNLKVSLFFTRSVWMMKWNQMTHCLDRIGFLKKIWFLFDIVMGGGGESHRLFTSLTLNNYARGKEGSFQNSRLSRLSPLFPHLFNLNRFDIASTIPWTNSCTFLREWRHVIHNSFQPSRRLTSCSHSFLFYSSSFSLVPSCCFYPSCTLVHDPNTIESYNNTKIFKYVISPVSS